MARKYPGVTTRAKGIQMSFSHRGNRIREHFSIEPNDQNTRAVSRRREAVLLDIELGRFDYTKHFPEGKNAHLFGQKNGQLTLFSEAANEWLKRHQKTLAHSTVRDYLSALNHHLLPKFGGLQLCEISTTMIRDWMSQLDISAKRINNVLTPLRLIFQDVFESEIIDKNPLHRITNLKLETREPEPFSESETRNILSQLDGQNRNLIQFAFTSGLRTSEIIGLTWDNVDFKNDRVYVRQASVRYQLKTTKTTAGSRTVELNDESRQALISQKELTHSKSDFVFIDELNPGTALDDQKIRKRIWTPALKRAGVQYRSPYQTRHTFASRMLQDGKSPAWVAAQLGHKNAAVTFARYARFIPKHAD